ncbi:MAG: hypothetical protein Harvfovirus1_52 [Harvfovirus sp.]|uniref:Uncharacterized protein n=1 Tax=Harvfovirus sp. TaxID=2487768 RepID=A0A3G4ZZS7_9VIRU|nr:MAG: hypothetical protein Harvfovirus1_52 [Harvfovirus sp.]
MPKNNDNEHITMKYPYDSIKISPASDSILNYAVDRVDSIVKQLDFFLRSYLLYQYEHDEELITINKYTIETAIKCLTQRPIAGPPTKNVNKVALEHKFIEFYNKHFAEYILSFSQYHTVENVDQLEAFKIDKTNLTQILSYTVTNIMTNINSNIKFHFFDYLRRFVNQSFKASNEIILSQYKGKAKIQQQKILTAEIFLVKNDLINYTITSDPKYHNWLNYYRPKILPTQYNISLEHDIDSTPQKYLKYMITMNKLLEEETLKGFQFFPLRTSIVPSFIPLDSTSLVELFIPADKKKYLFNIIKYKDEIWSKVFQLNHKVFKLKGYQFDYNIMTDGYTVCLKFIKNEYVDDKRKAQANKNQAGKDTKQRNKDLSPIQIDQLKKKKEELQQQIKDEKKLARIEKKKEFDNLPKHEQTKIIAQIKQKLEFLYFDKLSKKQTQHLGTAKKIYADPGKRSILYMMDDEGNYLNYTNAMRMKGTKRLKYQKLRENFKKRENVNMIENQLSSFNSKTCNYLWFMCYIEMKMEIDRHLKKFYSNELFRKLKWFSYINTKREDARLLNLIEKKYGKDITIIIGDWSEFGKVKYMSTPGIGLRRKLAKRFKVYMIDEFRTSCLHHKTEQRCENLHIELNSKVRKIHSVLTYQMQNKRVGCINRDRNAVQNMRKIVHHYLATGERLERYSRSYKIN